MITLLSILGVGLFLGMRHATDADHVLAISTIVTRQHSVKRAAFIGVLWGIGHSLTVAVAGIAIVLFGVVIPERLGLSLEFGVALMLIVLGALNLKGVLHFLWKGGSHSHAHCHDDYVHDHVHGHTEETHGHTKSETPPAWLDLRFGSLKFYQTLRPIIIGVVHGLAGSAAVALLVVPLIRNPFWAMVYLLIFGVGTILGMMLITAGIAVPLSWSGSRQIPVHRFLAPAAGLGSLAFGMFMVHRIGFVEGLFRW